MADDGSLTYFGPGVAGDRPGEPNFDSDSYQGIGHIHGQPFNLNTPGPQPSAMHPEYAASAYPDLQPGGTYISRKDGKMHRWMDTTGSHEFGNEDLFVGAGGKYPSGFSISKEGKIQREVDPGDFTTGTGVTYAEPKPTGSLLSQIKSSVGAGVTDEDIIKRFRERYASHMDENELKRYLENENGSVEDLKSQIPKIDRLRSSVPSYRGKSDDDVLTDVYERLVKSKRINPDAISKSDIRDYLMPPTDWVGQSMRFLRETLEQVDPQTNALVPKVKLGLLMSQEADARNAVNDVLTKVYPGQDITGIRKEYDGLSEEDREKKLSSDYQKFVNAQRQAGAQPKGQFNLGTGGVGARKLPTSTDLTGLKARMEEGYAALAKTDARKEAIGQLKTAIGSLEDVRKSPYISTPQSQQQLAKTIASLPSQTILQLIPGLREIGNRGSLYYDNYNVIRTANPAMSQEEVDRRTEGATDAQWNLWEILSVIPGLGPEAAGLERTLTQRLSRAALTAGKGAGIGGTTMSASQVVQNLYALKHPMSGVTGAFVFGAGLGAGTHLGPLTVESMSLAIRGTPELFKKLGHSDRLKTAEPEEVNKYLKGDRNNEIDKGITRDSLDLVRAGILGHVLGPETEEAPYRGDVLKIGWGRERGHWEALTPDVLARRMGELPERLTPEQLQRGVEQVTRPRSVPGKMRPVVTVPEPEASLYHAANEAFAESLKAQRNGDHQTATQKANEGLATLSNNGREKVQQTVAQVVAVATHQPVPGKTGPEMRKALDSFWGLGIDIIPLDKQTEKITPSDQALGFTFDPFRGWKFETPDWIKKLNDWDLENLHPERASVTASDTGSIIRRVNPKWAVKFRRVSQELAEEHFGKAPFGKSWLQRPGYFPGVFRDAFRSYILNDLVHADRRWKWFDSLSKVEQTAITDFYEAIKGKPIEEAIAAAPEGSTIAKYKEFLGSYFKFYRALTDKLSAIDKNLGIEHGHIEDYIMHMVTDQDRNSGKAAEFWATFSGRPGYTKQRVFPTMKEMEAYGLHPERNMEKALRARVLAQERAIKILDTLEQAVDIGAAIPEHDRISKEGGINPAFENAPETWKEKENTKTAATGERYRMAPDASRVFNNAFGLDSIYSGFWLGGTVRNSQFVKGLMTPLRLAWSGFHALHVGHILASDIAAAALDDPRLIGKAIFNLPTLGMPAWIKAIHEYRSILDVYNGKAAPTAEMLQDLRDLFEMGSYLGVSPERSTEWEAFMLAKRSALRGVARIGYDVLLAKPYQEFLFGHAIPSAKAASALMRRNALINKFAKKGINLRDPENALLRQREFTKIGKQTDARFGELYYDNLFWTRAAKQLGTALPLSLGWQLGFLKIYGDGIVDLSGNIKAWAEGAKQGPGTNAIAYAGIYTGMAMLYNLVFQAGMTGSGPQNWEDAFYPRVGKRKDGTDERIRPPWFTTEFASIYEHETEEIAKYGALRGSVSGLGIVLGNKMNPGVTDLIQLIKNKDFYGRRIDDPESPTMQRLGHLWDWFWKSAAPISWQSAVASDPNMSLKAKTLSVLGLGPAPASANRTPLENEIIAKHGGLFPQQTKGYSEADWYDKRKALQAAYRSGDQRAIAEALHNYQMLGASDRQLADARKYAKIPPAALMFKHLGTNKDGQLMQLNMLRKMTRGQLKIYLPFTAKAVQEKFSHLRQPVPAGE